MLPANLVPSITWHEDGTTPVINTSSVAYEYPLGKRVVLKEKTFSKRQKCVFSTSTIVDVEDFDDNESVVSHSTVGTTATTVAAAEMANLREVKLKLQACKHELIQLLEVIKAEELGKIRVERTPLSNFEKEQSLAMSQLKRHQAFDNVISLLQTRVSLMDSQVRIHNRAYFRDLETIAQKFPVVCPTHSSTLLCTVKPDDLLAVVFEPKASPVYLHKGPHGMHISLEEDTALLEDAENTLFQAQCISVGLFVDNVRKGFAASKSGRSLDDTGLEAYFRHHQAKKWLDQLGSSKIWLSDTVCFHFQLIAERNDLMCINKFDGICSLALNLLQRGKSKEVIATSCAQLLHFPSAFAKFPQGIWMHSEDEEDRPECVETRCLIPLGLSGRFALEFVGMRMDWHNLDEHGFYQEKDESQESTVKRAQQLVLGIELRGVISSLLTDYRLDHVSASGFELIHRGEMVLLITISPESNVYFGESKDTVEDPFGELRLFLSQR